MMSATKNRDDIVLSKENRVEIAGEVNATYGQPVDSQVKIRKTYSPRRSFDTAYKLRIIAAYNACESASDRGALLRKEGLYHSRICLWKQQFENSKLTDKKQTRNVLRMDHLVRENEQLKKKLAHAEAIIDL